MRLALTIVIVFLLSHRMLGQRGVAADINAMHAGAATCADIPEIDHYISRQASQQANFDNRVSDLLRPYFGATLEPVLDRWLDTHSRT